MALMIITYRIIDNPITQLLLQLFPTNPSSLSLSQIYFILSWLDKQKLVINGMLTITDLNKIIKFYATKVQQRIQQLQHFACFSFSETQDEQEYDFIAVISRYANYSTKDEKEVRLAKKLQERVVQIFQFFRGKSNNQNLLGIIQGRIEKELAGLVNALPVRLGEMFSYIHLVTKRGCAIRPPAAEKRRVLSKSIIRQPLKIQEKMTTTFSLMNVHKRGALSNSSNKHIRITPSQKWKLEDAINGIWSGLDLDRAHLLRIKQTSENLIYKDAMRRNENIAVLMRKYDRKRVRRTTMTEFYEENRDTAILTEVKFNTVKGWGSKKRRPILATRKKHYSTKENISILG